MGRFSPSFNLKNSHKTPVFADNSTVHSRCWGTWVELSTGSRFHFFKLLPTSEQRGELSLLLL